MGKKIMLEKWMDEDGNVQLRLFKRDGEYYIEAMVDGKWEEEWTSIFGALSYHEKEKYPGHWINSKLWPPPIPSTSEMEIEMYLRQADIDTDNYTSYSYYDGITWDLTFLHKTNNIAIDVEEIYVDDEGSVTQHDRPSIRTKREDERGETK